MQAIHPTPPQPVSDPRSALGSRFSSFVALFALFTLELAVISWWRLPDSLFFDRFAFCDHGANLTVQYLMSRGLRPALDFGYHYGLLPLLIGRVWFGVLGMTPRAYQAAMLLSNILFAWALARIYSRLGIGPLGFALTVIALGYEDGATYPNIAHVVELVLLSHALAQQASGAYANALGLTTAAVFDKPSMGYFYGALLVGIIGYQLWESRSGIAAWLRAFAPAIGVAAVLSALLAGTFGVPALIRTVFPLEGAENYRALNFGFFHGIGSQLWKPPGMPLFFYFVDVSGFWLASTVFLWAWGAVAAIRLWKTRNAGDERRRRYEIILTCALLHALFIFLFFGNRWTWVYYSYVLIAGVAAAADLTSGTRRVALALCAVALLSWTDMASFIQKLHRTTAPRVETAGLYASAEEAVEWSKVLRMVQNRDAVILDTKGAAELLFPGFEMPVSLYLDPGLMQPSEILRKVNQLSTAQFVIVAAGIPTCSGMPQGREFASAMKNFDSVWKGTFFEVFRHSD